jgi:hypothetical protein
MILVKKIRVLAYEKTHPNSGKARTPYSNDLNTATVEFTIKKGISIGKELSSLSNLEKQKLKELSFGNLEIPVRFPILVSLDGNGKITNCAFQLKNYFDEVCEEMLDGLVDKKGSLNCKNITLYKTTSPATPTALISDGDFEIKSQVPHGLHPITQSGDLEVRNRVQVGDFLFGPTTSGSLELGAYGTVKGNTTINSGSVYFGDLSGSSPVGQKVKLDSPNDGELEISGVGGPSTPAEGRLKLGTNNFLQGKNARLGLNSNDPTATLDVNGETRYSNDLRVEKNTAGKAEFIIGDTVKATFKIVGGKLQITGANVEIYDRNNQWSSSEQLTSSFYKDYVAKRGWVWRLFDTRLGSVDAKNGVVDAILDLGGNQALVNLRSKVCGRIRRGSSISSSWNGSTCDITLNTLCGSNQALYGFSSTGHKRCRTVSVINSSCPEGYVVTGVNTDGRVRCTDISATIREAVQVRLSN